MNKLIEFFFRFVRILVIIIIYGISNKTNAQTGIIINPDPAHFLFNKFQIYPSSQQLKRFQLTALYQNRTGIFADIRNLYSDALIKSSQGHIMGFKVFSQQETSVFSKSKLFFLYSYSINISDKFKWTMGTHIGAANISFGASSASGGGSAWNWDGSISTTFELKNWEMAISLNQIPAAKLRPINYQFQLKRYLDSYLSKTTCFDSTYYWQTGLRMVTSLDTSIFTFDNNISYKNSVGALIMMNSSKKASIGGYVTVPNIFDSLNQLRLLFSYEFSFGLIKNYEMYNFGIYITR